MRRSSADRWLPLAYFAGAVAGVLLVLPTALRPPPQAPPTSARLSPDAPPDDAQVVLTEVARATSRTAGAATRAAAEASLVQIQAPGAPPSARRGVCFGNPPRQTESLYSAPCAPAFVGQNGGATSKGVTANEINIGVVWTGTYNGPVKPPHPDESTAERQFRTWEEYFNERYELYGRRLRLIMTMLPGGGVTAPSAADSKAAVDRVDDEWPLFGFTGAQADYPSYEEAMRRKAVVADSEGQNPNAFYRRAFPYAFSWLMDADKSIALNVELLCKQFAGRPPELNERMDPTFDYTKPRRFGAMIYNDGYRAGSPELFDRELDKCGEKLREVVLFNFYDNNQGMSGAATKMRAQGVTTILMWTDGEISPIVFTNEATNSGYFPEWWMVASSRGNQNATAQGYNPQQWRHAFGAFSMEIARPPGYDDCSVAFKSQNPDDGPGACVAYRNVQQFANGIQLAGPRLTPETFWQGLRSVPCRPPVPDWSIGGCYGPEDYTYSDYLGLAWWDPNADAPDDSDPGAYRYMYGGKRFTFGEFPDRSPWFKEGVPTPATPEQDT